MGAHDYAAKIVWTGNKGAGTSDYAAYARDYDVKIAGKPVLKGSADPAYRGDAGRHHPEDLLLAALSACHLLWYLHLCAEAGIVVAAYEDAARGRMRTHPDGAGEFEEVVLAPRVTIAAGDPAAAEALHEQAHALCFIARSVNFPVRCAPETIVRA